MTTNLSTEKVIFHKHINVFDKKFTKAVPTRRCVYDMLFGENTSLCGIVMKATKTTCYKKYKKHKNKKLALNVLIKMLNFAY